MSKNECERTKMDTSPFEISNSTNQLTSNLLILWYDCTLLAPHTHASSAGCWEQTCVTLILSSTIVEQVRQGRGVRGWCSARMIGRDRSEMRSRCSRSPAYQQVAGWHRSKRRLTVARRFLRLTSSSRFAGECQCNQFHRTSKVKSWMKRRSCTVGNPHRYRWRNGCPGDSR
jgi:hypothetical protein